MKKTKPYTKSKSQIDLERILHQINDKGLVISRLKYDSENFSLYNDFTESLTEVINVLVHEDKIHDLIASISKEYTSLYYKEIKEYDTLYETISETYLGLHSIIPRGHGEIDNTGRVRIDTFLDKGPDQFVRTLRYYIRNDILLDKSRKYSYDKSHTESESADSEDDDSTFNKSDSAGYNKSNIDSRTKKADDFFINNIFKENVYSLIAAVIDRFRIRKPVAAYVFLCIMNETYSPTIVASDLKSNDFNRLFHAVLHNLSSYYEIDLSTYDNDVFNADKYLVSFRNVSDKTARARIDHLAYQTKKDVQKLEAYQKMKRNNSSGC